MASQIFVQTGSSNGWLLVQCQAIISTNPYCQLKSEESTYWNFKKNTQVFFQKNIFESVIYKKNIFNWGIIFNKYLLINE